MLTLPPPLLRVHYINERVGSLAIFVRLRFRMLVKDENFNRNFVEVYRRNKIRTLTSQSELSKLLEELFECAAGDTIRYDRRV